MIPNSKDTKIWFLIFKIESQVPQGFKNHFQNNSDLEINLVSHKTLASQILKV